MLLLFQTMILQIIILNLVYNNPDTGVEKPEIIAPGHFTFPQIRNNNGDLITQDNGSSYSTPYVASAFGVNLLSQYPLFRGKPELLKAFLLSISTNITGESGILNPREGAGTPRYDYIYTYHRVSWTGEVSTFFPNNGSEQTVKRYMTKGKRERIAIAWLIEPTYAKEKKALNLDFSLDVTYNGSTVKNLRKASSTQNPFEIVEFTPATTGYYIIKIKRESYQNKGKLYLGLSSNEMNQ